MTRLDAEGLFGTGAGRHSVVVTVEVPSEAGDHERALRLNPPEALTDRPAEAARTGGGLSGGQGKGTRAVLK